MIQTKTMEGAPTRQSRFANRLATMVNDYAHDRDSAESEQQNQILLQVPTTILLLLSRK